MKASVIIRTIASDLPKRQAERLAAAEAVSLYLGHPASIGHRDNGAPFICGHEDVHLSVSHSRSELVAAFASAPIGVDVEFESPRLERVVPRVMNPQEKGLPLLETWCAKEAVFKAAGDDSLVMSDITVAPDLSHAYTRDSRRFNLCFLERGSRCIALAWPSSLGREMDIELREGE